MPVVVSVLIFIIYYIINNTGYKMARDGNWEIWQGMWISTFILAPVGGFFTYKSNKDSVVFNADTYLNWLKRVAGVRAVRHIFRKEVIIQDPDYGQAVADLDALTEACHAYVRSARLESAPNYLHIWLQSAQDEEVETINNELERLVDDLSNSRQTELLNALNAYPVLSAHAHKSPFKKRELNLLAALLLPVGLLFYFRIWIFRLRLNKDLRQIVATNEIIKNLINKI